MRPENWGKNIERTSKKLQGVKLTCGDFEEVIQQIEDDSFVFIDPPYYNADQDKFYTYYFSREEHFRLCKILKEHQCRIRFLLTYDNTTDVRELYDWASSIYDYQ